MTWQSPSMPLHLCSPATHEDMWVFGVKRTYGSVHARWFCVGKKSSQEEDGRQKLSSANHTGDLTWGKEICNKLCYLSNLWSLRNTKDSEHVHSCKLVAPRCWDWTGHVYQCSRTWPFQHTRLQTAPIKSKLVETCEADASTCVYVETHSHAHIKKMPLPQSRVTQSSSIPLTLPIQDKLGPTLSEKRSFLIWCWHHFPRDNFKCVSTFGVEVEF